MFRIIFSILFTVSLLLGIASCGSEKAKPAKDDEPKGSSAENPIEGLTPEQAAKVVAKVGDTVITVGEVTEQINRLSPYIRRRWATPEKRKEFLQKLIRIELLSQEAIKQGLEDDPEVQRTVKQVMIRLMVKNDLQKEFLPTEVDDKTLREEYEKQTEKFHKPPQIRISHIIVKTEGEATALIKNLKAKPQDRKLFREKASALSLDEKSKNRGGDLGYFSKGDDAQDSQEPERKVANEVIAAAWTLAETGDIADKPVKSAAGYHVIKLTNKKPELNRSFESVKRLLENKILRQLRREKMDDFVQGLRDKAKVKIYDENLDKFKIENSADASTVPVPVVGKKQPAASAPPAPGPNAKPEN